MKRLDLICVGLVGATVGLLVGLGLAYLTRATVGELTRENERLADERNSLEVQLLRVKKQLGGSKTAAVESHAAHTQTNVDDWGELAAIPRRFGPGSAFFAFIHQLGEQKAWKADWYWQIDGLNMPGSSDVHLNLTILGEGKTLIELVYAAGEHAEGPQYVTLLFKPSPWSNLKIASPAFVERVAVVGRSMELTEDEQRRLVTIAAIIPLTRPNAFAKGLLALAKDLPGPARTQFANCLQYYLNPELAKELGVALRGEGPAVGFALSDRYVVELVFMAIETSALYDDANYYKLGAWWSLRICPPWDGTFTSPSRSGRSNEEPSLRWPRLGINEVDALLRDVDDAAAAKPPGIPHTEAPW